MTEVREQLVRMMPAEAYTSEEVLAWERRHLYAGTWTCLGRVDDLFPDARTNQRALVIGDIGCLVVRDREALRMFANTCRHRGHELMPEGETAERRLITCPYHAWTYDLGGTLKGAPGFKDVAGFEKDDHGLVELPVTVWHGWVFGHALHPPGSPEVPAFETHLGELAGIMAPYDAGRLVLADRHTYEVAANWKVIAENYHECYHCPSIHPELCEVSRPDSGKNYDAPRAVGGRRDGPDRGHGDDVHDRRAGRDTAAERARCDRRVPARAAQPADLRAPRLRDDAPDGAAGAEPHLDRVLVVDPARRRAPLAAPSSSGTSPTARTGARASRCSAGWRARTSGPARSHRTRTRSGAWSRSSAPPTARGARCCDPPGLGTLLAAVASGRRPRRLLRDLSHAPRATPLLRTSRSRSTSARASSRTLLSPRWRRCWIEPRGERVDRCPSRPRWAHSGPNVLVVDASVLAVALADDGRDGDKARARLRGEQMAAPALIDLEVASVLRGRLAGGHLDNRRAELALADLVDIPVQRAPHRPLLARCWELRANLTVSDAAYVALAEALDSDLLTGDVRLAKAPGPRCRIEILS